MIILNEKNKPILLEDINDMVNAEYFWIFDASIMDFTLSRLFILEEFTSPNLGIDVGGNTINLPADWYAMVVDAETSVLDMIQINKIVGTDFTLYVFGPNHLRHDYKIARSVNYFQSFKNTTPSLGKTQLMCHPISRDEWILVTPHDIYIKYFKDKLAGDLI